MKLIITTFILIFSSVAFSYENPEVYCNVNNSKLTQLSCSGKWVHMNDFPDVRVKMKECFGFKSSERLQIEVDGKRKVYSSVIFPFSTKQDGYLIKCNQLDRFSN